MKKGDKFIVTNGKYQGMILTVRVSIKDNIYSIEKIYPEEDLENGATVEFRFGEYREWTKKDEKIKSKFHKLFQVISDNKTTLVARAANDTDDNYVRRLIELHQENMMLVKEKYDLFLYERNFSDETIAELNEIWRKEKESIKFYIDPKWVYDKTFPSYFLKKYTEEEIKIQWRMFVNPSYDNKAHAYVYSSTS